MNLLLKALFGWLGIGYLGEILRRRKLAAPTAHDRTSSPRSWSFQY